MGRSATGCSEGVGSMVLQRYRLNLTHLTLPEIKDFNALGDRSCVREKAKRFMKRVTR